MNEKLIAALDIQNMFPTCEMIIKSALLRKESRAAHYRSDFKKINEKWRKNIICSSNGKNFKISTRKIGKISGEISKFLRNKEKPEARLLE